MKSEATKPAEQQKSSEKRVRGRPFPKGVSGNPNGRRKGSVSILAALKRALSRPDAERICERLIAQAKAGDLQAVKLLFDRLDHPLHGPIAVAVAQAGAQVEMPMIPCNVQVVLPDNSRGATLSKSKLDQLIAALQPSATPVPAAAEPIPGPEPSPRVEPTRPAVLEHQVEPDPQPASDDFEPVLTGAEFLAD